MKWKDILRIKDKCLYCIWSQKIPTGRDNEKIVLCWRTSCPHYKYYKKQEEKKNENKSIN